MSNAGYSNEIRGLDFIIIGAQKSGTTSLFHYLKRHPNIYMPAAKEIPFFNNEEIYKRGWESLAINHFSNAPIDCLLGKATPHYMCDITVPERIWRLMPEVKLIALLRHPVERAISHYKMCVRRNMEHRSAVNMIEELLKKDSLEHARSLHGIMLENEIHCYLVWGEYGRIMKEFLNFFPREQLLVLFTEELKKRPEMVLRKIYQFFGVRKDFLPSNLGKMYYVGGTKQRLPQVKEKLKNITPILLFWRALPNALRLRLSFWYEQWNVITSCNKEILISPNIRNKLWMFYQADIRLLENLTGLKVPWENC